MTTNSFGRVVEANRANPQDMQSVDRPAPQALKLGQVLARVNQFALTANNATYALFGEPMGYWDFFPAAEDARGVVPVWGFATITHSAHKGIPVGTQLYGFWPFAQQVLLEPTDLTQHGFSDGTPHRQALHSVYNAITYTAGDPFCQGDTQLVPALRPLFSTAWLLEDFFHAKDFYGASDLVLTSASSKTSLGTAYCLKTADRFGGKVVGLTSKANAAFVAKTGLYDAIIAYDDLAALDRRSAAVIDFAGNVDVITAVHSHYGDQLRYSCQVGKSHSGSGFVTEALAGPQPVLFFAPDHARDAVDRLGVGGFQSALHDRWTGFAHAAGRWFDVEKLRGLEAAQQVFKTLMGGQVDGSKIFLVEP